MNPHENRDETLTFYVFNIILAISSHFDYANAQFHLARIRLKIPLFPASAPAEPESVATTMRLPSPNAPLPLLHIHIRNENKTISYRKMATRAAAAGFLRSASFLKVKLLDVEIIRTKTTTRSGRVLPKPKMNSLSLVGSFFVANAGILTGASFSRAFANFLEEHDLFVVEDDDDDD